MNIEEFDQKMKSKMDKMGKFSKNLSELILQKEYMIVQSSLKKKDGFVGDTSNLAEKLVDSIQELTIGSTLLGDALNRASQFRDKSNVMNFGIKIRNEASFQEAVKILEGKSVKMALREVSIMRRGAFDDAEEEVFLTPDETLKLLGDAFRETQTYLLKITNAIQDAYNGIEKAEMLMKDLQPKIQENDTRLEKIDQILKVWKGKVNQDPIGVINALENEIFTPLKQEDLRIKEELQKKEDCEQKINEADENLKNLEELDRQVSEKIIVLKTKISDWTYKPLDMENARELFVWFDGLKKTFERGKYDSCLVGFSKWNLLYGQVFQERFELNNIIDTVMNRREELRGRFSALQAKRKSCLDMPDWQNNNLLEQENHLINILFSAITPLTKAETLLKNYESDLHSVNLQKKIKG